MINVFQKNTYTAEITYISEDQPVDVSGMTFVFIAKNLDDNYLNDDKAVIKIELILDSNEETAEGKFYLNLTAQDTSIPCGKYKYQMSFVVNDGRGGLSFNTLQEDFLIIKNNLIKEV